MHGKKSSEVSPIDYRRSALIMILIFADAANAPMRVSVKQKCFQFVLERVQRNVCGPQIIWQTVPHSWSTHREAAVTVTCPGPWDDELARVGRS